jgi:predicted enzyme related to lactoylglutathione lyase
MSERVGVRIYVTDLALASSFYCDALGLFVESPGTEQVLHHKQYPFFLDLTRASDDAIRAVHKAFEIAEGEDPLQFYIPINDSDAMLERLRSKGITPASVKKYPFAVKIILSDPFGNLFMLNYFYPLPEGLDRSW